MIFQKVQAFSCAFIKIKYIQIMYCGISIKPLVNPLSSAILVTISFKYLIASQKKFSIYLCECIYEFNVMN